MDLNHHVFLPEENYSSATIGFSKDDFRNHKGVRELKYYLLIAYLRKYVGTFGHITTSLMKLIQECGYSTNTHSSSTYNDWRNIIDEHLIKKRYVKVNADLSTLSPKAYFEMQLSYSPCIFFTEDRFVLFNIGEYEAIVNAPHKISKAAVVGVYLFIKQYIAESDSYGKLAYPSKRYMQKELGLSKATVESAITCLCDLKLLFKKGDLYVQDNKSDAYVPARCLFSTDPDALTESACVTSLEALLQKKVYTRDQVEDKIKYL